MKGDRNRTATMAWSTLRQLLSERVDLVRNQLAGHLCRISPKLYWLALRVMPADNRALCEESGEFFKKTFDDFSKIRFTLSAVSSQCADWLTEENFKKLDHTGGSETVGRLIMMDAIRYMGLLIPEPQNRKILFERYAVSGTTFNALIMAFFTFGLKLSVGNVIDEDGPLDPEGDPVLLRNAIAYYLSVQLATADPERWNQTQLFNEIRDLQEVRGHTP